MFLHEPEKLYAETEKMARDIILRGHLCFLCCCELQCFPLCVLLLYILLYFINDYIISYRLNHHLTKCSISANYLSSIWTEGPSISIQDKSWGFFSAIDAVLFRKVVFSIESSLVTWKIEEERKQTKKKCMSEVRSLLVHQYWKGLPTTEYYHWKQN